MAAIEKQFVAFFTAFQNAARKGTLLIATVEILARHLVLAGREIVALSPDAASASLPSPPSPPPPTL